MSLGQLVEDVRLAVEGRTPVQLLGRTAGIVPTPAELLERIESLWSGL
jgi:2-oxoglutarate ferredoxin oxidoreductase subunit alpha